MIGYVKRLGKEIKETWKEDRSTLIVYFTLRALVILCMVLQILRGDLQNVLLCVLTLILLLIPFFVEKYMKIDMPNVLEIITMLFVFSAEILGEINNFYGMIPFWDTMLHTLNGFLMGAIGFSLVDILNKNSDKLNLSPIYLCLFAFCFSMTVGVAWEFFEYGMDEIMKTDMQKDEYVSVIRTVTIDPKQNNNVITIDNIAKTIVYDKEGKELVKFDGYLDIGIKDTMKDLIVNFIGAAVFNIFGYLYLKNKEKHSFVEKIMIKKKEA